MLESNPVSEELQKIIDFAEENDNIKIIISTRPLHVVDYEDLLPSKTTAYKIEPLTISQVLEFFKYICKELLETQKRLFNDLKENDLFRQLPKNPISAILLAQIYNDSRQELPSNLTDIYKKYSEIMLGRWEISHGYSQQTFEAASSIISDIACEFIRENISSIEVEDAKSIFIEYLQRRNLSIDPDLIFQKVTTRSGIIQINAKNNKIYFKHRSFVEYFYALYKSKNYDKYFIDNRIYYPEWMPIYFFFVGLHKDCEDLLNSMIHVEPNDTNEKFYRFANMANYFLAAYATPYDFFKKNIIILFKEYAKLYLDIVNNKVESGLQKLPVIIILDFFQAVSVNCYGYNFFRKSILTAIDQLENEGSNEEIAYSLFFIAVILRFFDLPGPYDKLLSKFEKNLPFPIKIGILFDGHYVKKHSKLFLKYKEKIGKELKKNQSVISQFNNLYLPPS